MHNLIPSLLLFLLFALVSSPSLVLAHLPAPEINLTTRLEDNLEALLNSGVRRKKRSIEMSELLFFPFWNYRNIDPGTSTAVFNEPVANVR